MGKLTREHDWSLTPIGSPDQWPQSLRTTVSNLLHSKFPMFLWWGDELIQFYNDAYRPSLGKEGKHPTALGQKGKDCWPEIWETIYPLILQVKSGGNSTWMEDQLIPIFRNGQLEDVYWTFSYSPAFDEEDQIQGVLVTCMETTTSVLERKKLVESEDQLRFAIEAAELGTWDYNPLTNQFTGNERLKKWFGLSFNQEIDLSLAIAVIVPKDRDRVKEAIQNALAYDSGGQYDIEYSIINSVTNQERIVRAKGKAWFNKKKQSYRFNGTLQDVTAKTSAYNKLKESDDRFHNLIYSSPSAIGILMGPELIITMANESIIEIWGKGTEIIGRSYFEALPELAEQGYREVFNRVYTTGIEANFVETPVRILQNGKMTNKYYNFVLYPQRDANGEIEGIGIIATEVTSQAEQNRIIKESEARFRTLAETLPQLVWMTDEKGNQEYASSKWKDYTGIEPTGPETWQQMIHPIDLPLIMSAWNESMEKGIIYRSEARLKNSRNEYRWFFVQGEPIRNEAGKIVKWIGAFTDIQDQKDIAVKLKELVNERTKELQRSNEDLQQFAHVASHDLKEPLRKIRFFTDRLYIELEENISEKVKHYLSKIDSATSRMSSMIDGVLLYSTIDVVEQLEEQVNLAETLLSVENDLELLIAQKQAVIEYQSLPTIRGYAILLYQLFYNLISNSLKFAKEGVPMRIQVKSEVIEDEQINSMQVLKDLQFIKITVSDNGIGFHQNQAIQIFQTFLRLNPKDKYEGSGLGLALCKKIVERHCGSIKAEGVEGKGATFHVILPR